MRASGILLHISSLPSPHGIGTMGAAAKDFVDFLVKAGQAYWQILPVCPTSYGDSPYQSFSTFAGNPYFIDLDMLAEDGLLRKDEIAGLLLASIIILPMIILVHHFPICRIPVQRPVSLSIL